MCSWLVQNRPADLCTIATPVHLLPHLCDGFNGFNFSHGEQVVCYGLEKNAPSLCVAMVTV